MLDKEKNKGRLLVVDNDSKTLKLLELRLKNDGYQTTVCDNGRQALQLLNQVRPELILVDVNMPGMSGLEVLSEVKLKAQDIPVVIITAYSSEEIAVEAMKKGANDYIIKPFNSKEISQVIKENIEKGRILRNRNRLLEKLETSSTDLTSKIEELEKYNRELIDSIKIKSEILADLENTNYQLRELSIRDGLTKLYNHAYFQERLSEEFSRCQRYNGKLSFIMVDIDNFKQVNDYFGHQIGDEILVALSNLLMESIRGIDVAARYGGEEFALILPHIDIFGAQLTSERLKQRVESHFAKMEHEVLRITISQGVASIPHEKIHTKTDLIRAADNALYIAKKKGKNGVELYESN